MTPREILSTNAVIPVMAIDDLNTAVELSQALVDGGVRVLEITLRTPVALEAIRLIKKEVPNAIVGAGTVINATHLQQVADAGASFAISPGFNVKLGEASQNCAIPLIPGVATAGELMLALEFGLDTLKLFPAQAIGGRALLESFVSPFPQVKFCPTGGISLATAPDYLQLPNVLCVGGSWLTPKNLITHKNWADITELAHQSAQLRPSS